MSSGFAKMVEEQGLEMVGTIVLKTRSSYESCYARSRYTSKHSKMIDGMSRAGRRLKFVSLPNREVCRHHGRQRGVSHGTIARSVGPPSPMF